MTAAVLAALAVWCVVPGSAGRRVEWLTGKERIGRRVEPQLMAALLVPLAGVALLGPLLGVVVGAAVAPMAYRIVGRLESAAARRRAGELAVALPASLDLMVSALEAGRPPVDAFALVAEATPPPLGPELAIIASRLSISADPATVWRSLSVDPVMGALGRAFGRAQASGMPVAEVVSGVALELRREHAAQRRHRSRRVAVQTAAPLGACFLPAFFLIGIVPVLVASFASLMP